MDSLISIERQDKILAQYLEGTFSKNLRAIPMESLNLDLKKNHMTFRLVPVEKIPRIGWWRWIWRVLRLDGLCLSLGGLLASLSLLVATHRDFNIRLAAFCFLPVACLHIAMNLFNDYYDHVKGVERIGAVKSIQMGWVRAVDLYYLGWVFLFLGAGSGIVAIVFSSQKNYLLILLAALGILEFSSNRLGLKYRGYGELTLFLLTGPFLNFGLVWAISGQVRISDGVLGILLGTLTVTIVHLNNLREILSASQAGVKNLVTRFGFDQAKKIQGILFIILAASWWFLLVMNQKSVWAFGFWLLGLMILKWVMLQILKATSPMASVLRKVVEKRFLFHSLILILLIASLIA